MITYSNELKENIEKISSYYLWVEADEFTFLQKIMAFMYEGINHIEETYFILPKEEVKSFVDKGMRIWENNGNETELEKLRKLHSEKVDKIKPVKLMSSEEAAAYFCIWWFLYNGRDDHSNYYWNDFIELFIENMETLNVEENFINKLYKKYFGDKLEEINKNWEEVKDEN
jgi:hypothetical protein